MLGRSGFRDRIILRLSTNYRKFGLSCAMDELMHRSALPHILRTIRLTFLPPGYTMTGFRDFP